MKTTRRDFLRLSSLAAAGLMVSQSACSVTKSKAADNSITGLQLYTIRDEMRRDPIASLHQVAEMGYHYVEHAGYADRKFYGISPTEFKKVLDGEGLEMVSGHVQFGLEDWDDSKKQFKDRWKHTIEDGLVLGQTFLITPWMDEAIRTNKDTLYKLLDIFNRSGELCKQMGIKFGYHNHDFEFSTNVDGKMLYDIILAEMEPGLVAQQFDMGNMLIGGAQPLDIMKKHPYRFELMHVKDEIPSEHGEMGGKYESTTLGDGMLKVKKTVDLALKKGGTRYFIVEQESYQNLTPMEAAAKDLVAMKKWGFR